jgi:predicted Fe-S protein YdhL (DUF1289 family)
MPLKLASSHHLALFQAGLAAMQQAGPVPSPCVSRCRIDVDTGWCEGCLRTIDEIMAWPRMPDDGKRAVWQQLVQRLETLPSGA